MPIIGGMTAGPVVPVPAVPAGGAPTTPGVITPVGLAGGSPPVPAPAFGPLLFGLFAQPNNNPVATATMAESCNA
jgi:hypothetical protein